MRLRQIAQAGGILFIFVLPLVCLCQLVPGQGPPAGPYLLLLAHAHGQVDSVLTDAQLADLAAATGQAVSVGDDGEVIIGYDMSSVFAPASACSLIGHSAAQLEQNPVLRAILPLLVVALGAGILFVLPLPLRNGLHAPYRPAIRRPPKPAPLLSC